MYYTLTLLVRSCVAIMIACAPCDFWDQSNPFLILWPHSSTFNHFHFNRLDAEFTRTPEYRNAILIFKRNHVAAASQQKQVLVRLTGILQAFLTYEKKVELLMELMS